MKSVGRKCIDIALETMAATGGSSEEFGLLHRIKNVYNASDEEMRVYFTDMTADISDQVSRTQLTGFPKISDFGCPNQKVSLVRIS